MTHSQQLQNAQRELQQRRRQAGIPYRPPAPDTNGRSQPWYKELAPEKCQQQPQTPESAPPAPLKHHGDIAVAAMRAGEACHYQLWLCLRLLDPAGSGRLCMAQVKNQLTKKSSFTYMYRWARLRQLLVEGNGRFWHYDEEYIWLRSTVRLAADLGLARLNGRFCSIAKDDVVGRTAVFRANCYAAWLSNHTNPLSQATIERLTGIPPRTQRRYCRLAGIDVTHNFAVGPPAHSADRQECAWQHGNIFDFTDYRGRQGPEFRRYLAWHLPSSYAVDADHGSRRQQRQTNRTLLTTGLAHTGSPGNGRQFTGRLFYATGAAAAKAANRRMSGDEPASDIYWHAAAARSGTGVWHVMSGH